MIRCKQFEKLMKGMIFVIAELLSVCQSAGLWELVHLHCGAGGHHDAQIWLNSTGEQQCIHSPYFPVCSFIHSANTHWVPAVGRHCSRCSGGIMLPQAREEWDKWVSLLCGSCTFQNILHLCLCQEPSFDGKIWWDLGR